MSQRKRTASDKRIFYPIRQRSTRSGTASVSEHQCSVYRFDCDDDDARDMVIFLQGVAAGQKAAFKDIFPWESNCTEGTVKTVMFVSLPCSGGITIRKLSAAPPPVCGWLVATYSGRPQDGAFVSKLSTRAATDRTFGGVGTQLLQAVEAIGAYFIYLYPVDSAIGFYEKSGYAKMVGSKYMLKIVVKNKTIHLPRFVQSVAASLDEVGQFMKDAAEQLSEADHKRLEAWIAKNPDDVYAAKEYLKDPESLRAWLDKIYKTGGRSARRKGKGT